MGELASGKETTEITDAAAAPVADAPAPAGARRPTRAVKPKDGNVGVALRSVYQQTVNEDVPDEMMQLLGKLI